ncbi:nuclear transport factor 2 family protein [Pseudoxanthomonas mexicana]|uniref:nuclear transport factor 2 family protein n=1 Tax=Pseudoxanthomonas mexicana TaxID=128785 RepID=UPI001FD654CB|nr:nuclear transport factor 2 family protein [Pseudoxanthomonas mexicana]UOV00460.1 nuclear transport factor 2 family protein [Pseudoxanthomonas mexicana]
MSEQGYVVASLSSAESIEADVIISHAAKVSRRTRTRDILLTLLSYLLAVGMIATARAEYPITDNTRALDAAKLMLAAEARGERRILEELLAPDYLRISHAGEVETRSEILGPLLGVGASEATRLADHADVALSEVAFEETKDGVIIVALQRSARTRYGDGRDASLRVTFMLEKRQGRWVVLLTQYTPLAQAGS